MRFFKARFRGRELYRQIFLKKLLSILEPQGRISYSQRGEDLCIRAFFKNVSAGYYVDVGCSWPKKISNTFHFYQTGWRGLCIDANDELCDEWKAVRPRDQFVVSAISDVKLEIEYKKYKSTEYNTLLDSHVETSSGSGLDVIDTVSMTTRTLSDIFEEESVPREFEFLNIDVEGMDLRVLRSVDFGRWRPRVICIEAHEFDQMHPERSEVVSFCQGIGYEYRGFLSTNVYFAER